ncbi:hypothetical protein SESBI_43962 [Sesbania bispinosa]|nr:hypothetical protein SESBI_43962 [Sesbania bispinosa]
MGSTQRCGSCTSEKKKMVSRCSSSSSISHRNVCGCGERTLLMILKTTSNLGRTFWRCPNWNVNSISFFLVHTAYSPPCLTSSHPHISSLFDEESIA